jgi:hypothetical protein
MAGVRPFPTLRPDVRSDKAVPHRAPIVPTRAGRWGWLEIGSTRSRRRQGRQALNRVFEFRNLTPIEAFVLAADSDRATQLFELHLIAHGGRSDTLRWREWPLDQLEKLAEPEQASCGTRWHSNATAC